MTTWNHKKIEKFLYFIKKTLLFSAILFLISMYQNCSLPNHSANSEISKNPNKAPISEDGNEVLVAPDTLKSKLINGTEVPGFEAGTWIFAFVDDKCVLSRKDKILNSPFYFLDSYLKDQYDFQASIGKFNVSLISFQLTTFVSKDDLTIALSLDACATGGYASISSPKDMANSNSSSSGTSSTWNQMGLDNKALNVLLGLNKSTKVNVAIVSMGVNSNTNPKLPLAANAIGLSTVDPNGFGTFLASTIASPRNSTGFQGAADGVAQLIPLASPSEKLSVYSLFSLIKQSVNRGSEVLLLPYWKNEFDYCNPLIGQALYYAVVRGTTIVVPAGKYVGGQTNTGAFVGPRDFNLFQKSETVQISCWARYFRGVINVASSSGVSSSDIATFSNYGAEGVELIAPGQDVIGIDANSNTVKASGTEASAALTTAAVAHIISFYKSKNWFYSPWLIEDTLLNGSITATNLPDSGRTVRRKKVLNFTTLASYLNTLDAGTEANSKNQPSDNPESDQSINLSSNLPGELPTKLDVFTKESTIFVKDRSQFQAVFYYVSGSVKVVTEQVTWTSSDPVNFPVDSHGIVRPTKVGTFMITAKDPSTGLSSSFSALSVDFDPLSSQSSSKLVRLELRNMFSYSPSVSPTEEGYKIISPRILADVYAVYEDGTSRLVTDNTVYTVLFNNKVLEPDYIKKRPEARWLGNFNSFRGGQSHDLILFYRGFQQLIKISMPNYTFVGWKWGKETSNNSMNKPIASLTDDSVQLYNLGSWFHLYYKVPMCLFLNKEVICPDTEVISGLFGSGCDSRVCGVLPSTTLPSKFWSGSISGSDVQPGTYKLDQQYQFWGDGLGSYKTSSITLKVVEVPKTLFISFSKLSAGGRYPSGVDTNETTQLVPLCSNLGAEVRKQNVDFGLNEYHSFRIYGANSSITVSSTSGPYSAYIDDKNSGNILFKNAADSLEVNFILSDLNLSKKTSGPKKLISDPLDENFNSIAQIFSPLNLVTPRNLPPLPSEPELDPSCLQPAKTNGSHNGNGSVDSPYIICSWEELSTIANSIKDSAVRGRTYLALGKSIDLTNISVPLTDLNGIYELNGRNYRIKNALFIDSENSVFILKNLTRIHHVVFQNNNLTGKLVSLFSLTGGSVASDIFSFDNTLVGVTVTGIGSNVDLCSKIYTKNQIRYSESGIGICDRRGLTAESFSQDKVTFTGLPGAPSTYLGVGYQAVNSGSSSEISGGTNIGGIAYGFCYKCYSNVVINTTNSNSVGGILIQLPLAGTIEVGESNAQIIVAGSGYTGGIAATSGSFSDDFTYPINSSYDSFQRFNNKRFAHTNLINSKFTGNISGTGTIGGLIGIDNSQSHLYITNTQVTGNILGAGVKGSLLGRAAGQCVTSEFPSLKTRNVNRGQSLPAIGKGQSGAAINSSVEY